MDKNIEILSQIAVFNKYARYKGEENRRETWEEILERNMGMHLNRFPSLSNKIKLAYDLVREKKVLPSMRSLQFAGRAIELNPSRIFNCAYLPIEHYKAFSETMFLLLGGTGVGYSVQKHHVDQLPAITKPDKSKTRRYIIGDSIEGWADAIKVLMRNYLFGGRYVRFIYDDIRPKGALLVTAGGKAPGPEPLKICIEKIQGMLEAKEEGSKLSPIECHDILCHIADAVLAGGIRRAAMISLFSEDDEEMLLCKSGEWFKDNPQRGRANNSAVLLRSDTDEAKFGTLWAKIKASGSGEPGFYFTNDRDWGTNPCCEIALRPYQFCNLTEINASNIVDQADLNNRAWAASFIGTLQASYTDFHYLRVVWQETTEKDALIGVSMTGIASNVVFDFDLKEATDVVIQTNKEIAKEIGIRPAARTTCVKPAGTTSLVLGTSSGIHAWHNDFYLRRMGLGKNESLYHYLAIYHPELLEDDKNNPKERAFVVVPQRAPEGSTLRTESPISLLERVKAVSLDWVKQGHIKGVNTHNVSATVSIKDDEWDEVRDWMWENREVYNGLSVMPYDGGTYVQTPFEDCSRELYEEMSKHLTMVDLSKVVETGDNTTLTSEAACAGGSCEIL